LKLEALSGGYATGSREEVPEERKPVIKYDNNNNNNNNNNLRVICLKSQ
jgi:hypothetical protein